MYTFQDSDVRTDIVLVQPNLNTTTSLISGEVIVTPIQPYWCGTESGCARLQAFLVPWGLSLTKTEAPPQVIYNGVYTDLATYNAWSAIPNNAGQLNPVNLPFLTGPNGIPANVGYLAWMFKALPYYLALQTVFWQFTLPS